MEVEVMKMIRWIKRKLKDRKLWKSMKLKNELCNSAQRSRICNGQCDNCAWKYADDEEELFYRELNKIDELNVR